VGDRAGGVGPRLGGRRRLPAPRQADDRHDLAQRQRRTHLPTLARGEKICVIAQTEPGAGSDVAGIQSTARPTGDGWVLNGTKRFITAAMVCDLAVVVATTDRAKGGDGIALFLVESGTPGFSRGSKEDIMGVRLATGELVFEDCRIPAAPLLASPGEGFKRSMVSVDTGRIGMGAECVGLAQPRWRKPSPTPGSGPPSARPWPASRRSSS
jgi:alkylation response protein AidB-like acyl-CoA dehydrogenase